MDGNPTIGRAPSTILAAWSAELRLAVECCRPKPREERLAALVREADWPRFLATVDRHRIAGLAVRALAKVEVPDVPAAALSTRARANIAANLRASVAAVDLADRFEKAGIKLRFVKGLTLSALAYGDAFLKMSADIDLLIDPASLPEAASLLTAMRFVLTEPAGLPAGRLAEWHVRHKETGWFRASDGIAVDLHSRLADSPALLPRTIDSPSRRVEVAPGVRLPTLGNAALPAYLAVHGASSCWFRLKWIADFAALCETETPDALMRQAEALGAERPMTQALLLSAALFDCYEGHALAPDRRLLSLALAAIEGGEPTERRFGTLPIHCNQLLMKPGLRFMTGEAWRQLCAALANRRARG